MDQTPTLEGPSFHMFPGQPTRISYFLRLGSVRQGSLQTNRGELFGLHDATDPTLFIVGIGMLDGAFTYSNNGEMVAIFQWSFHWKPMPKACLLPKSQYWYSEIQVLNNDSVVVGGGIGACSTTDLITWRNEGIVLHYANLTDPFGMNQALLATRPKVVLSSSGQFVLWVHVDNPKNEMGLSGVATADFPNGPFRFQASFYPSGATEAPGGLAISETHDQTVVVSSTKTHYGPVGGKRVDGSVDYSLNFHRAFFTKE
ncbi:hypothetical protein H257_17276 [Aphanomyces astaci]|uniref:Uncharacterized protein n=1 Tax=Aphanomyces astaci TaxID=112090 RepID=W4FH97_APHAT|nr:hypothetical protein H257_17276 [Aphanomyces astaci]ETV66234.1 hypothetical protein H257_17276 [Aphanomyces astaci]|eukprot:XP_009844303.1 hypothetical protein H257_17276 [Aphanomyces astaci]